MESENVQSETNDQALLVEAMAETQSTQTTNNGGKETQVLKKRTIKLTPKALMEKLITLQKVRASKLNKASNLQKVVHELMEDRGCEREVRCSFQKYLHVCKEAREAHESLLPLLPPEEKDKHGVWFQAKMLSIDTFIADMEKWMKCADGREPVETVNEEDVEYEINPHDSISNVGSKRSTGKSHRKSSSSTSSRSSTSSAGSQAEAERAALAIRAVALRERHALEEQEEMLRKKKEMLELDTQLAAAEAEVAVLKPPVTKLHQPHTQMEWTHIIEQEQGQRNLQAHSILVPRITSHP